MLLGKGTVFFFPGKVRAPLTHSILGSFVFFVWKLFFFLAQDFSIFHFIFFSQEKFRTTRSLNFQQPEKKTAPEKKNTIFTNSLDFLQVAQVLFPRNTKLRYLRIGC